MMRILISYHNKQGYENIISVARYLKSKSFNIELLDLCSFYIQQSIDSDNFARTQMNLVIKNKNNYRNLSKLKKIIFYIQLITLNSNLFKNYDGYLFSPGGFIEGQIAKILKKNKKPTFFIEGGLRTILFVDYPDKTESTLNNSFLNHVSRHYVSGVENKNIILNKFPDRPYLSEKIIASGVPRYENYITENIDHEYKDIENVLYLTTAASYHNYVKLQTWHDDEMKILNKIIGNSSYNFRIRIHPRDDLNNYSEFSNLNISSSITKSLKEDVEWSDVVVTIPSSTVFEVNRFGKPYLILWPFKYNTEVFNPDMKSLKSIEDVLNKLNAEGLYEKLEQQKTYSKNFVSQESYKSSELISEDMISFF